MDCRNSENAQFQYGDEIIHYDVSRLAELESKIRIHVHPDGTVEVAAPDSTESTAIQKAVLKRARWIKKQRDGANDSKSHVLPRRYMSGEPISTLDADMF